MSLIERVSKKVHSSGSAPSEVFVVEKCFSHLFERILKYLCMILHDRWQVCCFATHRYFFTGGKGVLQ